MSQLFLQFLVVQVTKQGLLRTVTNSYSITKIALQTGTIVGSRSVHTRSFLVAIVEIRRLTFIKIYYNKKRKCQSHLHVSALGKAPHPFPLLVCSCQAGYKLLERRSHTKTSRTLFILLANDYGFNTKPLFYYTVEVLARISIVTKILSQYQKQQESPAQSSQTVEQLVGTGRRNYGQNQD